MNVYGDAINALNQGQPVTGDPRMMQTSLTPTVQPQMQRPHAIGGFVGAGGPSAPMAPAQPLNLQPSGDPRMMQQDASGQPPVSGDPRQMQASGATMPPLAAPQSASNMYADYLKNQQQNLSSYLSGVR